MKETIQNSRTLPLTSCFLLLVSCLFIFPVVSLYAAEPNKIKSITITGNERVEEDALKALLSIEKGEPYSPSAIRDDIKSLFDSGLLEDVQVDVKDTPEGKEVTFIVKERPLVRDIIFLGSKKFKTEELMGIIELEPNFSLSPSALKKDLNRIKEFYKGEGHYSPKVDYKLEELKENRVVVIFNIEEGKKLMIKKISFQGNKVFKDKKLKKVIQTREKNLFSLITQAGTYKKNVLEIDLKRLTVFYLDNGYIEVQVGEPLVTSNDKWIYITIPLAEGPQYKVGDIGLQGDFKDGKKELLSRVNLNKGQTFKRNILEEDIEDLTTYFADQGYAFAHVAPLTEIDKKNKIVHLSFDIDRGKKTFFDQIQVKGNTYTIDKVIRRELTFLEGEGFSATKLKKSKEKVQRLGYFEEVNIETEKGSTEDQLEAKVTVKERQTGSITFGGGFGSEGFIGSVGLAETNLFGKGYAARISAQKGDRRLNFQLDFTDPYFRDTNFSAGTSLFTRELEFDAFTSKNTGGSLLTGTALSHYYTHPIFEDLKASVEYTYELVDISDFDLPDLEDLSDFEFKSPGLFSDLLDPNNFFFATFKPQESNLTTSSITTFLSRDTRNDIMFPSKGSLSSISVEFAGLGGDSNFVKTILESKWYFPIFRDLDFFKNSFLARRFPGLKDHVLSLRGEIGFIETFGDDLDIPLSERFFLGGFNSVRGFKAREIGPRRVKSMTQIGLFRQFDVTYGGTKEIVFNIDYIIPIMKALKLYAGPFFDVGNAFDEDEGWSVGNLRKSIGIQAFWQSPFGPIKIAIGTTSGGKKGEDTATVDFAVGAPF